MRTRDLLKQLGLSPRSKIVLKENFMLADKTDVATFLKLLKDNTTVGDVVQILVARPPVSKVE